MLFLILIWTVSVFCINPGASASLDMDTIKKAQDVYFDFIMNALNNAPIDDISFSQGYIHSNSIYADDISKINV
jgi:hypothetical protein